jgi:hypothetical protein
VRTGHKIPIQPKRTALVYPKQYLEPIASGSNPAATDEFSAND